MYYMSFLQLQELWNTHIEQNQYYQYTATDDTTFKKDESQD